MRRGIIASILNCDFSQLGNEVKAVDKHVDGYQIDVMDGHYVPNLSFGFPILEAVRKLTKKPLEADLMISNPDAYAARYAAAGADYVIVHVEACKNVSRTFRAIRNAGAEPGISLNPKTPAAAVREYLPQAGMVIVMTVEPGFGGQKFMAAQLAKVRQIRKWAGKNVPIEVDGGINAETAKKAVAAGADLLVAGSSIYQSGDYQKAIAALRKAMK